MASISVSSAPVIETERLRLRGHGVEDLEQTAAMWAEPQVTRFIGGKPLTAEETWSKILRYAGHWPLKGFGYWLIEEKSSGRLVGETGFMDARRTITPSFNGTPEMGWGLAPWAWGKGFAREAVRAALGWGDRMLGGDFVCMIHPENSASIMLASEMGFCEYARTTYHEAPSILLRRDRSGLGF